MWRRSISMILNAYSSSRWGGGGYHALQSPLYGTRRDIMTKLHSNQRVINGYCLGCGKQIRNCMCVENVIKRLVTEGSKGNE